MTQLGINRVVLPFRNQPPCFANVFQSTASQIFFKLAFFYILAHVSKHNLIDNITKNPEILQSFKKVSDAYIMHQCT